MRKWQDGLLLHVIDWRVREDEIEIAPQIKLCKTPGSVVGQLYELLCRDTGLDENEPYAFGSHLLLDSRHPGAVYSFERSYSSPLVRLSNVIALILQVPIGMSRVIVSEDGFESCKLTEMVHEYGDVTDFLEGPNHAYVLDAERMVDIIKGWSVAEACWFGAPTGSRLAHSLARFESAWREGTFEALVLNLGISLALLFPGMLPGERSERLASVFGDASIRANIERFLEIHGGLVGGSMIPQEQALLPTLTVYGVAARLLKSIILDENQAMRADEGNLRPEDILSPKAAESCAEWIRSATKFDEG